MQVEVVSDYEFRGRGSKVFKDGGKFRDKGWLGGGWRSVNIKQNVRCSGMGSRHSRK